MMYAMNWYDDLEDWYHQERNLRDEDRWHQTEQPSTNIFSYEFFSNKKPEQTFTVETLELYDLHATAFDELATGLCNKMLLLYPDLPRTLGKHPFKILSNKIQRYTFIADKDIDKKMSIVQCLNVIVQIFDMLSASDNKPAFDDALTEVYKFSIFECLEGCVAKMGEMRLGVEKVMNNVMGIGIAGQLYYAKQAYVTGYITKEIEGQYTGSALKVHYVNATKNAVADVLGIEKVLGDKHAETSSIQNKVIQNLRQELASPDSLKNIINLTQDGLQLPFIPNKFNGQFAGCTVAEQKDIISYCPGIDEAKELCYFEYDNSYNMKVSHYTNAKGLVRLGIIREACEQRFFNYEPIKLLALPAVQKLFYIAEGFEGGEYQTKAGPSAKKLPTINLGTEFIGLSEIIDKLQSSELTDEQKYWFYKVFTELQSEIDGVQDVKADIVNTTNKAISDYLSLLNVDIGAVEQQRAAIQNIAPPAREQREGEQHDDEVIEEVPPAREQREEERHDDEAIEALPAREQREEEQYDDEVIEEVPPAREQREGEQHDDEAIEALPAREQREEEQYDDEVIEEVPPAREQREGEQHDDEVIEALPAREQREEERHDDEAIEALPAREQREGEQHDDEVIEEVPPAREQREEEQHDEKVAVALRVNTFFTENIDSSRIARIIESGIKSGKIKNDKYIDIAIFDALDNTTKLKLNEIALELEKRANTNGVILHIKDCIDMVVNFFMQLFGNSVDSEKVYENMKLLLASNNIQQDANNSFVNAINNRVEVSKDVMIC